jgi:hypothetical protein
MVIPGMLPQLAIGLADELGAAAAEPAVAALAPHPTVSKAARAAIAAAAIGAARRSGRRNRFGVDI